MAYYTCKTLVISDYGRTVLDDKTLTIDQFNEEYAILISQGFTIDECYDGNIELSKTDDEGMMFITFSYNGGD